MAGARRVRSAARRSTRSGAPSWDSIARCRTARLPWARRFRPSCRCRHPDGADCARACRSCRSTCRGADARGLPRRRRHGRSQHQERPWVPLLHPGRCGAARAPPADGFRAGRDRRHEPISQRRPAALRRPEGGRNACTRSTIDGTSRSSTISSRQCVSTRRAQTSKRSR